MNQNPNNKTGCLFPFGDDIFPFLMFWAGAEKLNTTVSQKSYT